MVLPSTWELSANLIYIALHYTIAKYPKMYAAILEKVFLLPVFENFSEIAEKRTLFKIIHIGL